jgi:CheY-like chemotaxis protein
LHQLKQYVERPLKNLLVVEDDLAQTMNIRDLIGNGDVSTTFVSNAREALEAIKSGDFDCMVLDVQVQNAPGTEVLNMIQSDPEAQACGLPTILYSARDPQAQEVPGLAAFAQTNAVTAVRSLERLLDETSLVLHRNVARLPERQRKMLEALHHGVLEGKKVLLVDDDIRNIFAMTSVLERFKMCVVSAENGKDAIRILAQQPDVAVVLMDIMLPTMDGYATMRAIREQPRFKDLPIIAVTAKAMKGDREKCLAAGASDYLCKPVEAEHLRSALRLWLAHQTDL